MDRFRFRRGIGRRQGATAIALALALLVATGGCSGVKVHQRQVLERVDTRAIRQQAGPEALIQAGIALDRRDPAHAIVCYRDAALLAYPAALADSGSGSGAQSPLAVYNRAIEYAVTTAHRLAHQEEALWTEILAREGIAVRGQVSSFAPGEWVEALPARAFEVEGFRKRIARGGWGAPLVLSRNQPRDPSPDERYFPPTVFKAATALIRPSGATGPGEPPAVLELHDPVRETEMLWTESSGAPPRPLAYDLTTPLARQYTDRKFDLIGTLGVLFPSRLDAKTGLYMIDPYEPGKIPVVFVHGLNSSPEAWTNALNELRGDPELRKRYQFWLFFYSTGNPIVISASRLRTALNEMREQFDPTHLDPAADRTVLIGHSMGGLLSRLMITSSGQSLWNAASNVPPEKVDLDPDLRSKLVHALIFEPVPSVRRVVFIATPHRGSPIGDELAGRLVSSLITLPSTMRDVSKALIQANGALSISPEFRDRRQMTGVAQLATDNPVLRVIDSLPFSPTVAYHSIIGFNGRGTLADGGDGVVPYKSAHLEGALSEHVVTSSHSVQETEKAVIEMHRLLVTHLGEYDADRLSPTLHPIRPIGPTPVVLDLAPPSDDTAPPPLVDDLRTRIMLVK